MLDIRILALAAALGSSLALSACSDSPPQQGTPPVAGTASPTRGALGAIDPCTLLSAADAQTVLHKTLSAGRKVATGDLTECVYDDAGPLIIAVLKSSFTTDSFQQMITKQDTGPYADTTGKAESLTGLGDMAFRYDKASIVEALKGGTVVSITSASTTTSIDVARAVLAHLP